MLTLCNKMLDYCDINFEDENGKIACAFSNCYLEKVKIKKTNPDQILVSLKIYFIIFLIKSIKK